MQVCGIVSEYNPFHNGHAWQIARTRETLGDCAVVCVMSGAFVQRGEAAILPKASRARMALLCGADLVLELPSPYSLLSAEGFAQSAVHILARLNVLTHLSFGAETDDISALLQIAGILLEHRTVQHTLAGMKDGLSYAAARERALFASIKEKAALISTPNNILAVEYIKALISNDYPITPLAIPRKGANHDSAQAAEGFASASTLRAMLKNAQNPAAFIPAAAFNVLHEDLAQKRVLVDTARYEAIMLSALLRHTPDTLRELPGISEGLEHRVFSAIRAGGSLDSIARRAQTRRYPLSRIRRVLARAALGLTRDISSEMPAYARVLAVNERGQGVLRIAAKRTDIPLVTKPAHIKKLGACAEKIFQAESFCHDIFSLSLGDTQNLIPGSDWTAQIVRYMPRKTQKNLDFEHSE